MLRWRLLSAAVMIAIAVTAVAADYQSETPAGLWLLPIGLAVALLAADELDALLAGPVPPLQRAQVAGVTAAAFLVMALPVWYPLVAGAYPIDCPVGRAGWLGAGVLVGGVLWFLHEVAWFDSQDEHRAQRIARHVLSLVYPTALLGTAIVLRQAGDRGYGLSMVVAVIAVTKMSDAGAYFGGRTFGRRRLAPVLSPKKTWEGALAGLLAGVITAAVYFAWIGPACFGTEPLRGGAIARSALFGVVVVVAGVWGDLFESLLKRDAGKKDSSSWLPGLGGILDTIDSLLFAFPVAWALAVLDWSGTGGQ
ncbi:MAG TPA: hypothetical protein ENJ50_03610 [Planctomycetaceae bacterium]|nr:hypothetical protein [Planctomycetaceae bacterium]